MSGEFITSMGCTIRVVSRAYVHHPEMDALVLAMNQPGDGRRTEVLLTDEERDNLRKLLGRFLPTQIPASPPTTQTSPFKVELIDNEVDGPMVKIEVLRPPHQENLVRMMDLASAELLARQIEAAANAGRGGI